MIGRLAIAAAMLAVAGLAGCATGAGGETDREATLIAMCEAFTASLNVAATFEPRMSEPQKAAVDDAVAVAVPLCESRAADLASIRAVRDALRALVSVQKEVQP